jgi:subtilisin family serine protease
VADPILLRINGEAHERNTAVRTALLYGADVISMSFGGDCNQVCRIDDRDDNPFDDEVDGGGKAVFVASAGNGRPPDNSPPKTPSIGFDVGADNRVHPCIEMHVICVGALTSNATTIASYSNFGAQVSLFAPTNIRVMAYPASQDAAGNALPQSAAFGTPVSPNVFGGTSASAPFVAGVVAMMKAVNPGLNHDAVGQILRETARPGTGLVSRTLDAYAAVPLPQAQRPWSECARRTTIAAARAAIWSATPPYSRAETQYEHVTATSLISVHQVGAA